MNKLFVLAIACALALWSLLVWSGSLLLGGSADFLGAQAAAWAVHEPEIELVVNTATAAVAHWGAPLMWLVWAAGALGLVACSALLAMLARAVAGFAQRWPRRAQPA